MKANYHKALRAVRHINLNMLAPFWPMWEMIGTTAFDLNVLSSSYHGTYVGGITLAKASPVASIPYMVGFDGSTGYITTTLTTKGKYRIFMQFALNVVASDSEQQLYWESVEDDAAAARLSISLTADRKLKVEVRSDVATQSPLIYTTDAALPLGFNLVHVYVPVTSPYTIQFYVDGVEVAATSSGAASLSPTTINNTAPLSGPMLGSKQGTSNFYAGDMGMFARWTTRPFVLREIQEIARKAGVLA